MKKLVSMILTSCLFLSLSTCCFAASAASQTVPEDTSANKGADVVADPAKRIKASNTRKKQIEKLCKDNGWDVSNTTFFREDNWFFLFDEEYEEYEKYSKEIGLTGKAYKTAYVGVKKYMTKGSKKLYGTVTLIVFYDYADKLCGVVIMPADKDNTAYAYGDNNADNIYPLDTSQKDILNAIKKMRQSKST